MQSPQSQPRAPDEDRAIPHPASPLARRKMSQRKPPMPCFQFPHPKSKTSTLFTVERRHFTVKELPDDFPYDVVPDNGLQIHYFEFRGHAPPPHDVGHPGDVWLNVHPGAYALHVRTREKWSLWPGPHKSKKNMFEHPLVPGRYLWCTRKHVLWYTCDGIRKSASLQTRGEENDFGRNRYRTGGALDRGAARAQAGANASNRLPLRTAEQAIAKILEMEEEERRQGPPEAKRRKIREEEGSEVGSGRASVGTLPTTSPVSTAPMPLPSNAPAPPTPATPFPNTHLFSTTTSSLSQALGGPAPSSVSPSVHGSRPLPQVAPFNPSQCSPTQVPMPIPQMSQPSSSRIVPSPLPQMSQSQPSSHPQMPPSSSPQITKSSPSSTVSTISLLPAPHPHLPQPPPQQPPRNSALLQVNPNPSPIMSSSGGARPTGGEDADLARLREEIRRLTEENRRLTRENVRLTEENQRLPVLQQHPQQYHQQHPPPSSVLWSPVMNDVLRETLSSGLSARVPGLVKEAQEHQRARIEAERKLAEFQAQLKKMTQTFQISTFPVGGDTSLSTPGPSPRMNPTDT